MVDRVRQLRDQMQELKLQIRDLSSDPSKLHDSQLRRSLVEKWMDLAQEVRIAGGFVARHGASTRARANRVSPGLRFKSS